MSESYSFRDFTNRSLLDRPASDFSGTTIRKSSFSQDKPDTQVFPAGSENITFEDCNTDNVLLPPGSTVVRGCHRRWLAQPDGFDWIVDENNTPVEKL